LDLSSSFVSLLKKIYDSNNIIAVHSIEALFTDINEQIPKETETIYRHVKTQIKEMISTWRSSLPEIVVYLENALKNIEYIEINIEIH